MTSDEIRQKKVSIISLERPVIVITQEVNKKTLDEPKPRDNFRFFRITCLILGLGLRTPSTFILTENKYWMYKFRNVESNSTNETDRTFLQANFVSTCNLVVSIASVAFMFLTTFAGHKFKTHTRVYCFFSVLAIMLSLYTGFVGIDTDTWQVGFFVVVMIMMVIKTGVSAVCGVGVITLVSKFPSPCMHYFLLGQGTGDIFTPSLSILTLAVVKSFKVAALMYFLIGTILMSFSGICFYLASKTPYFRYYYAYTEGEAKNAINSPSKIFSVFKEVWILAVLTVLIIILPVHTAITNLVVSEYKGTGSAWGDTYFVPVVTYLLSSIAAMTGRAASSWSKRTYSIPFVFTLTVIRTVVFPVLIYLCNAQPRRHLPVVFPHDWEYAIFLLGYRFLSGFLLSSSMLLTVKLVKKKENLELAFAMNILLSSAMETVTSFIGVALVNLL